MMRKCGFYNLNAEGGAEGIGFKVSIVELAWRSGSVMDCHATARSSIPGGNGVFTELHVLRKGQ